MPRRTLWTATRKAGNTNAASPNACANAERDIWTEGMRSQGWESKGGKSLCSERMRCKSMGWGLGEQNLIHLDHAFDTLRVSDEAVRHVAPVAPREDGQHPALRAQHGCPRTFALQFRASGRRSWRLGFRV